MNRHRLLLALRNSDLLLRCVDQFEQEGHDVRGVTDALACIEQMRAEPPDSLVVEPNLLWGGGDGILELIQSDPELGGIAVLVVLFDHNLDALDRILQYPTLECLLAPVDAALLCERIERLLLSRCEGRLLGKERRRAVRVHLALSRRLQVYHIGGPGVAEAVVCDVSRSGISLLEKDPLLEATSIAQVLLKTETPEGMPLRMSTRIVHVDTPAPHTYRLGCEFTRPLQVHELRTFLTEN